MVRGDVVTAATGSGYGGKPRPVVIVQSDLLKARTTLIVLGLTSDIQYATSWRPIIEPTEENGLRVASAVMADAPILAPCSKVDRVIGRLSSGDMERVELALMAILGLN